MADGGSWFKLWCSALDDEALDNLPIEDFGRWAKLGAYVKRHGQAGSIVLRPPSRTLLAMLQLPTFEAMLHFFSMLPNVACSVSGETIATVSFNNWQRYQGDLSTSRVHRFRARETVQKRREEKREDQKRTTPPTPPKRGEAPDRFEEFWVAYPRKKSKGDAEKAWKAIRPDGALVDRMLQAIAAQKASRDWQKDAGKWVPYPASWLRSKRWEDTVDSPLADDSLPPLRLL